MKDGKRDKESVFIGGLLTHKDPLCFIKGPSVFTRLRQTRRELGAKDLGQSYDQPKQVMVRMKNYATRPSALPFLTYTPAKTPLVVLSGFWRGSQSSSICKSVTCGPNNRLIVNIYRDL